MVNAAYPNPTNSELNIHFTPEWLQTLQPIQLVLHDALGRVVIQSEANFSQLSQRMDIKTLPNGYYFLAVKSEIQQQVIKILKQ